MVTVNQLVNIKNIGDKIKCKYATTFSAQIGFFSEFGNTDSELIPTTSSATPDGTFYWIYVGKDYLGRKKFIADRNIQHSISWDTLNNAGIINEKKIDLGIENESYIRLLNGGVSAYDTDNEWDQLINNSSLNNTIVAGDNNVWNYSGIYSWTSSTGTTSSNRILRGSSSSYGTNAPTGTASGSSSTTIGFRPVLLINAIYPVIDNPIKSISDNGLNLNISVDNISHEDNLNVKVKIFITKPDETIVIKRDYDASFQTTPFMLGSTSFDVSEFGMDTNTITITVKDINGTEKSWSTSVNKINKRKLLILDGDKLKQMKNGNLESLARTYSDIKESDLKNVFITEGATTSIKFNKDLNSQTDNVKGLKILALNINILE